jgi:microcystin degradation protein MlrC
MPRIVLAECMQEISSFNPLQSQYEDFAIQRGEEMLEQRGRNSAVAGMLDVLAARPDVAVVPTMSARAGSAGLLSAPGWARLRGELLAAIEPALPGADAVLVSLHGAMGADGELDPEGNLLEAIRGRVGPDVKIVISLDLHGILTDRMLRQIDGLAIYHTYPHVDFADTGARAARVLLRLLDEDIHPVIARVTIPALVRGDELITRTGCYGDLIRECQFLERSGQAVAAGVMIGNPFTDVPELCSQVLVMSEDAELAEREAVRLAQEFWPNRHRMQGKFISLDRAIAQARTIEGQVVFTDAPDATSSGATGDSNLILRALIDAGYAKRALAQIVDAPAAAKAHEAGVGRTIAVTLGGACDPNRFEPLPVAARVKLLSDGQARLETSGGKLEAGPTAVLEIGNITVVVLSRSVSLFDRALYYSNGIDPAKFDLIVVKSPHTEYKMYDAWVEKNFNLDIPGATSANLPTLGHTICARPVFPLDPDVRFEPKPRLYTRTAAPASP